MMNCEPPPASSHVQTGVYSKRECNLMQLQNPLVTWLTFDELFCEALGHVVLFRRDFCSLYFRCLENLFSTAKEVRT